MSKPKESQFFSHRKLSSNTPIQTLPTDETQKTGHVTSISFNYPNDQNSKFSLVTSTEQPFSHVIGLNPKLVFPSEVTQSENSAINYFFNKAFSLTEKGDCFSAIKLYKKILSVEPNHFESLNNLGICYLRIKMITEAVLTFQEAEKINKMSFLSYYNKALAHIIAKQYSSAFNCMTEALKVFVNPPEEFYKIRTFAIFKGGKVSSALDEKYENYNNLQKNYS